MYGWAISLSADGYNHLVISPALGKPRCLFFLQSKPQLILQNQVSLLLVNPVSFRNNEALGHVQLCFAAAIEGEERKGIRSFKVRAVGKS